MTPDTTDTIAAIATPPGQGGIGGTYSDIDYVRAIRHGVAQDGRGLPIMPSEVFNKFSDQDYNNNDRESQSVPYLAEPV